jgi:TrmH family RNA methyltransferase
MKYLESINNKQIKQTIALANKRERDKTGLFVLEGERLVSEITDINQIEYVIVSESYKGQYPSTNKICLTSDSLFAKLSETVNPQGIVAVCHKFKYNTEDAFNSKNPLFVILENVQDPGNLGTIIRTADAAGFDGVFLSKGTVDLYNPKVVRSTMGSIFHLPIYTGIDVAEIITQCKRHNVQTLAAHLGGVNMPYDIALTRPTAILIGNEGAGLTPETATMADELVRIPMPGKAESMNASIAAGILIYEAVRQRLGVQNDTYQLG